MLLTKTLHNKNECNTGTINLCELRRNRVSSHHWCGEKWENGGEQGAVGVDTPQPGHDLDSGGPLRSPMGEGAAVGQPLPWSSAG